MSETFGKGGSAYIAGLVREAVENGTRCATVTGKREIDEAIRLPSNFTVILSDTHLRLADGSHTNIFVNERNETELGKMRELSCFWGHPLVFSGRLCYTFTIRSGGVTYESIRRLYSKDAL